MKFTKKQKVAFFSVASNTLLIILKVFAGIMSGSVSIISEAIHSGMDLVASIIAYFSVTVSGKPADDSHPYGHGKIENVSGVIEALLIFAAAFLIVKEAIEKIINPTQLEETTLGIVVMVFAAILNSFVAYNLYKTAKEEDSIALEADALHLKTDVYTSLGVAVGLLLIKVTGIEILDPIVAIMVAMLIFKESWHLCKVAFGPLLDTRLDKEEEEPIIEIVDKYKGEKGLSIRYFKTRKSGNKKFIDFHVGIPMNWTIKESIDITNTIKEDLYEVCPEAHIHINIDAIDGEKLDSGG